MIQSSLAYTDYWAFAAAVIIALGVAHLRLFRRGKRKWITGADWMVVLCGLAYGWLAIDYAVKWQDARISEVVQRLVVPLNSHLDRADAAATDPGSEGAPTGADGRGGISAKGNMDRAADIPGVLLVSDPGHGGRAVVDVGYVNRKKAAALTAMQSMATAVVASLYLAVIGIVVYFRVRDDFLKAKIRSAQALAESEARFRDLYKASPGAILVTDRSGFVRDANPAACDLVNRGMDEIIGAHFLKLVDGNQGHGALDRITALAAGEVERIKDACLKTSEGEVIHVELKARKIQNFDGPACLVHIYDLTDRIALEQEIRQTQKMEGIGQLAAGVAHDFNNLLTVIQGHTLLLLDNDQCAKEDVRSLEEIAFAADRAAELTTHLLTFSRGQQLNLEILDVNQVVEDLLRPLGRILPKGIDVQTCKGGLVPLIRGDREMIGQVVTNLVMNARDAMPEGGRLELSTSTLDVDSADLSERLEARPGRYAVITIRDTGSGMDERTRNRIFEPFFTTKDIGEGAGLGLATVYGIVAHHGGWMKVASEPGKGSCFSIMLPARPVPALETGAVPSFEAEVVGGSETIFIVEDEPALRKLVALHLARFGYRVIEAASGREALRMWSDIRGEVDLLLTDLVMPEGVSGRELGERISSENHDLPIIYMSGYSGSVEGIDEEFEKAILKKPYTPKMLARTIRSMLDGK